jgi:hypothetical protein
LDVDNGLRPLELMLQARVFSDERLIVKTLGNRRTRLRSTPHRQRRLIQAPQLLAPARQHRGIHALCSKQRAALSRQLAAVVGK